MSNREFRFVLTKKCNYSCTFCHEEGITGVEVEKLDWTDYIFLFDLGKSNFNWSTVTLTGGEPLMRKDLGEILKGLKSREADIVVTTNGVLLKKWKNVLDDVKRFNLSLHVTDNNKFIEITRFRNGNIQLMKDLKEIKKQHPNIDIRLNATMIRGFNDSDEEIDKFIEFATSIGASIKYIEFFPPNSEECIPGEEIYTKLESRRFRIIHDEGRIKKLSNDIINIFIAKIFCVQAIQEDDPSRYCATKNDLFVSPSGKIKPCRFNDNQIDIFNEIKARDEEGILSKIREYFMYMNEKCTEHLEMSQNF